MCKEFLKFIKEYGVIGLAIAVIIGGKLNELITSLVNDLAMPLVFMPLMRAAGVNELAKLQVNGIYYGKVIAAGVNFFIVAFIVFLFAKWVLNEETVAKK